MTKHKPLYVIIGADKDGVSRAARYHERDAITVAKAAALTGYRIARAISAKAKSAARALPQVQIFSSGKALVPRARQAMFKTLNETLSFPIAQPCKTPAGPQKRSAQVPDEPENLDGLVKNPWASIKKGSLVLAPEPNEGGWYEAVVIGQAQNGAQLTLRWRDWPKLKEFTASRTAVAIPPSARPPLVKPQELHAEGKATDASQAAPPEKPHGDKSTARPAQ